LSGALAQLIGAAPPARAAIDAFLAGRELPLVDRAGVTFIYRGEAEAVHLRMFIAGLPAAQPLTRLAGTDLWFLRLELPEYSRFEYKFEVRRAGLSEWLTDPLNPLSAADPFGANSVCQGYGYLRPEWTLEDPGARAGRFEELGVRSRHLGERRVRLYLPARLRARRRYGLLVLHDGSDYLRYAELKVVLDNLIHRLEIPPLVVALIDPVDRLREYAGFDPQADFLVEDLLPAVGARVPLDPDPAQRALMGASFGAVAALHAAWRHPGVFGRLLLQSGSFAFTDIGANRRGEAFEPVVKFMNAFRARPGRPAQRIYLSCGIYESLIYENRSLLPLLQACGLQVRFEEARDGHNWQNWRDRMRAGLTFLFPGPLWMVYE
jgi:enterochelin esterase-like enzyme